MATVIKAWIADVPFEANQQVQWVRVALVSCDGGGHYHLYNQLETRCETLQEAYETLTRILLSATAAFAPGTALEWTDDTDNYDDPHIVLGEN